MGSMRRFAVRGQVLPVDERDTSTLSAGARRPRLRIVDWPDRARVRARIPRAGRRHRRPVDPGRDADSVDWRRVLRLLPPRPARRGGRSQRRAALRIAPRVVFRRLPARTYRWQRLVRGRRYGGGRCALITRLALACSVMAVCVAIHASGLAWAIGWLRRRPARLPGFAPHLRLFIVMAVV